MRLKDKIAIVTGGARGIGLAVANAYAREGAIVMIADLNLDGARTSVDALSRMGARALPIAVDVADAASVQAMVAKTLEAYGRLDILMNNAGVGGNTPFLDTRLEEWNRIISINLTGAFLVAQAAAREMVKGGGGKIVNIASLSGQRGANGRAAYGSAKAGLELLTKVMAVELAPHNINVNAIAPGVVDTPFWDFVDREFARYENREIGETKRMVGAGVPFGRMGKPEDYGGIAVFLASSESDYVVAQTYGVDGGNWMA